MPQENKKNNLSLTVNELDILFELLAKIIKTSRDSTLKRVAKSLFVLLNKERYGI